MAAVESQMLPLGTEAPDFSLPDPEGQLHSLAQEASAYLVMFICNHCPFVKHIAPELARLGRDYLPRGVAVYAINSNDIENYPDDSPELMRREAAQQGYTFPYLFDETQQTAKDYRAACTPDFYVFNADRKLVYRGQLDNSRPSSDAPIDGRDIRQALDTVLVGDMPEAAQMPSIGCNVKWKPGNAPDYF